MVVIDRSGRIACTGAIDETPSTRLADVTTTKNYLFAALDEIAAGKPVTVAPTRAYGCSIKYKGASPHRGLAADTPVVAGHGRRTG
jgi:hypothetical protein